MTKPVIVTRAGKGSALTWTEGDTNLTNLRDATITVTDGTNSKAIDLNGTITFTAGTNVTLSVDSGTGAVTINSTASGGGDVVNDTTPQLGGNLDVNGYSIVSANNGNIAIVPNGSGNIQLTPASGKVTIGANDWPAGPGSAGQVLTTAGGTGVLSWTTPSSGGTPAGSNQEIQFNNSGSFGASSGLTYDGVSLKVNGNLESTYQNGDEGGEIFLKNPATNTTITNGVTIDVYQNKLRFFENGGSGRGYYVDITSGGNGAATNLVSGVSALNDLTDVVITAAATGDILRFDGTNWVDTAESSLTVGTATNSNNINVTNSDNVAGVVYPLFVTTSTSGYKSVGCDGQFQWTPTTNTLSVTNLNGTIGATTPSTGAFTTLSASSTVSGTGFTNRFAAPGPIGSTTASTGAFTTLSASSTVSGTGFSTYLASPPAIGSTTASTGKFTSLEFKNPLEPIFDLGTTGGTIAPNCANGSVQKITLNAALTINAFTSPVAGQSLTLIIYGGTAYTSITSTMKFAGGIKTLTATAGCIDILTVYYDGTNYFASLGKGYA